MATILLPLGLLVSALLMAGLTAAEAAPRASDAPPAAPPFVIGSPGRLPLAADRRQPRRYRRIDSTVAAYADVEELADPTWLRHELHGYARRATDCRELGTAWCRRELRALGDAAVIFIAAGVRAEVLWPAGGNRAVRLGWRRVVETPTGTLMLDTPPAEFAAALLAELPSRLPAAPATDAERQWQDDEIDRLLYYIDRMLVALPSPPTGPQRRRAERFIAANLAQVDRLAGFAVGPTGDDQRLPAGIEATRLSAPLAERLGVVRAWWERSRPLSIDQAALPWCPAGP